MKNELKIRKLLGENFHLSIEYKGKEIAWKLFRYYEDRDLYYDQYNKAIMTSEDSTEKDLLKFAKKNHIYNLGLLHSKKELYIAMALLAFHIIRIFIDNDIFYGMWLGATIYLWIDLAISIIVDNHNYKVTMKILEDKVNLIHQRIYATFEEQKEKLREEE